MKKHSLNIFFALLVTATQSFSQFNEDDYKKQADEIRSEVWNSNMPFFDQRTVPAGYEKYSKVTLARREEITCLAQPKLKYNFFTGYAKQDNLTYTHLFREIVKINDVASLEDYSEISFQKFMQSLKDKYTAFLGFRIIKPDGTVHEINPDEIVLTEDKEKSKRAKLAVSNLQIGDMVDYFFQTVQFYSAGNNFIYDEFVFSESEPLLHYAVHMELNNKVILGYHPMNGAPDFAVSRSNSGDVILDIALNNISPSPVNLWLSEYRQVPMLRYYIGTAYYGVKGPEQNLVKVESSHYDSPRDKILQWWKSTLSGYRAVAKRSLSARREKIKKLADSYLQNNGGGTVESNSLGYYYAARHFFFLQPDKEDVTITDLMSNYSRPESLWFLSVLQVLLDEHKFDTEFIILPSRYGPTAGEAMYANDFKLALVTNDKHIYTAESVFDCPDQLPYYMEGQKPTSLYTNTNREDHGPYMSGYSFRSSPADSNIHTENLALTFDAVHDDKITVDRTAEFTGHAKSEAQRWLLLYEDYYEEERKVMGISETLSDELNSSRKGKKIEGEYQNAFADARKQWKEDVKDEIEFQFGAKPVELLDCNVQQGGIFINKPEFIYKTRFTVNAWTKTAGSNYILEVGKIITPRLKLKLEQRERSADVYMPYAKTFQCNILIPVPQGFAVEGLDKLNSNLENTTGSFVTNATPDQQTVVIHVTQTFKHSFEKVDKWPELLGVIDAAAAFENAKILLRKL